MSNIQCLPLSQKHMNILKHINIQTYRHLDMYGGTVNGGGPGPETGMEMLCVTSQSDVFCWGLQGFNYLNCLALCFSVKGETCMRQKDKQRYGAGA